MPKPYTMRQFDRLSQAIISGRLPMSRNSEQARERFMRLCVASEINPAQFAGMNVDEAEKLIVDRGPRRYCIELNRGDIRVSRTLGRGLWEIDRGPVRILIRRQSSSRYVARLEQGGQSLEAAAASLDAAARDCVRRYNAGYPMKGGA